MARKAIYAGDIKNAACRTSTCKPLSETAKKKGWIKIGNFRRSESKLKKVAYLLTPAGICHCVRLIRGYLARKEAEYEAFKAEIAALLRQTEETRAEGRG